MNSHFYEIQYCLYSTNADNEIDFYSLGLVEAFKRKLHTLALERKSKKTDLICFECEQISASEKCIQCEQNYCQQCSIRCHAGRIMRSHEIINISDSTVSLVNGYCSRHKQKPFTSYCKECKIHLCVDCVSEHSDEHDVTNIAKLVSVQFSQRFSQFVFMWCDVSIKINLYMFTLNFDRTNRKNQTSPPKLKSSESWERRKFYLNVCLR